MARQSPPPGGHAEGAMMATAELIDLQTVCAIHVAPWWADHGWELLPAGLAIALAAYGFGYWWRGRCPR